MKLHLAWNQSGRAIGFSAVICAMIFSVCIFLRSKGKLEYLECWAYDELVKHRGNSADLGNVVLVGVDENDLRALGHYPLNDEDKANLIERLEGFKARVIGWDIYMDPLVQQNSGNALGSEHLREQLTKNHNVVCAEYWGDAKFNEPVIPPPSYITRGRRVGFVDQPPDKDGFVRRALLYLSYHRAGASADVAPSPEAEAEPSLSINVANKFLEAAGVLKLDRDDLIHIDKFWSERIPRLRAWEGPYGEDVEQGGYQYLVKYDGPGHFKTYTLMHLKEMNDVAGQRAFGGKAVIIGMTADSVKDRVNTPIQNDQWGALQHVRLVDQLIRIAGGASPLRTLPWKAGMAWTLFWTALAGVTGYRLRSAGQLSIIAAVGVAVIVATAFVAIGHNWLLPVIPPLLCWLGSLAGVTAYMVQLEFCDRKAIRELFGKAVQKEVADEMWAHRSEMIGNGALKPREGVATLLFTDLKGFTTLAEHMKPAELINWINEYMAVMTEVVTANHGIVAKYMGDGIMAVFGMPLTRGEQQDARDAVACAMSMRSKMSELRARWASQGRPAPKMRVGIFTGPSVSGSVGSPQRQEYTILGDTTNTASRLESFDKSLMDDEVAAGGCRILIGEPTYRHVADRVRVRQIGHSQLTGRQQSVAIYAVLGPAGPGDVRVENEQLMTTANE